MKKRKLTKAQEAKLKASEKAKAKKKQKKKNVSDDDYDDEDDDPYSKLSMYSTAKPAAGSFADCAKCETKFTVVRRYSDSPLRRSMVLTVHFFSRPNILSRLFLPLGGCVTRVLRLRVSTRSRSLLLRGRGRFLPTSGRS